MTGITAQMAGGGSGPRVTLADTTIEVINTGATASAAYRLATDGKVMRSANGAAYAEIGTWLTPSVAALAALYECRVTVTSGTLTSGTTGTWLPLTADQTWTLSKPTAGALTVEMTLEIRLAATGTVMASATVNMGVEYV